MNTFVLPDLGEGLGEAEIVTWHVGAGDHVVADQPLLAVETDKAVVEIPSPRAGRIAAIHGEPGTVVPVGALLVEFAADTAGYAGESVVGALPHTEAAADALSTSARAAPGTPAPRAAPAVRALAARLGVDAAALRGSGPDGAITRDDVQRAAASHQQQLQPMHGVRRAMARNMSRAHEQVVPATLGDQADVHAWPAGSDITLRLVRALVAGCTAAPALNAWFLGVDTGRILHSSVHVGIATDTADGLFVPVLRDAGRRDAAQLRTGLDRMKTDLLARAIPAHELRGATITLSNFGMLGGEHATLVVMPPQVAILGAGRARERVVARAGHAEVRRTLPLSLTFDHRAVTGGEAAAFLAAAIADLECAA